MSGRGLRSIEMWRSLAHNDTDPEWWQKQLLLIEDGATVDQLCVLAKVHYSVYRNWIRGNDERERAFLAAQATQRSRKMERVLQATFDTALAHVAEPVKNSEKLRAAEILFQVNGATTGSPAAQAVANISITFVEAKDGRKIIDGRISQET